MERNKLIGLDERNGICGGYDEKVIFSSISRLLNNSTLLFTQTNIPVRVTGRLKHRIYKDQRVTSGGDNYQPRCRFHLIIVLVIYVV
jgi:hypothetical protein